MMEGPGCRWRTDWSGKTEDPYELQEGCGQESYVSATGRINGQVAEGGARPRQTDKTGRRTEVLKEQGRRKSPGRSWERDDYNRDSPLVTTTPSRVWECPGIYHSYGKRTPGISLEFVQLTRSRVLTERVGEHGETVVEFLREWYLGQWDVPIPVIQNEESPQSSDDTSIILESSQHSRKRSVSDSLQRTRFRGFSEALKIELDFCKPFGFQTARIFD
ncbi:hypothetical protein QBC35DRAFT_536087 [Podospora australis]|uniref:Uncharacterized protein n=1 Tax=Podospora australis TaxID=1536484 RepID=A0AAN6WJH9_9PEZI|nr:hypothetical protein QBC35DRAFT_536087 [Podospora australis]